MKASEEARKLFPYLLPLLQRALGRGGAGGSGTTGIGGAPTPHALSSVHHTGTLNNAQAPQFLLVDGSRTLTGDLAVAAGKTIDGVDISAHAANPTAHHALASAGNTGISVTGQAISLALNATSGLQISSGLKVGAGDGIDVLASTIAVDVTDFIDTAAGLGEDGANNIQVKRASPDSGLAFDGSGGLTLGTPLNIAYDTTNTLVGKGVSHSHAVTASSDVGTTPVESLLKSTSAGGLILGTLTVKGSVDIINGGDFTVGTNILFVDSSLESIGVNRAPDPQFDLDVAGNLRAAYIVGKHAIQLEDALLIAHYDNHEPHGNNPYGELNGHRGQVGSPVGGVATLPGKFYGAVSVGAAGTNLIVNPRFDVDLSGWSTILGGGSIARSTEEFYIGQASAKMVYGTSGAQLRHNASLSVANGSTITISAWVYRKYGTGDVDIVLRNGTDATNDAEVNSSTYGEWEFLQIVYTNNSGSTKSYTLWVRVNSADTAYVSGCQMVAGYPVPYIDGAMGGYSSSGKPDGSGYTWSGTAHNSTSSRVASVLTYNNSGNIGGLRGTVMFWANVPWGGQAASKAGVSFFGCNASNNLYLRKVNASNQLRVGINGLDSAIVYNWTGFDTNWHHFAVTWDGVANESNLYIDGILVAQGTASQFTPGLIYVGGRGGAEQIDGYIDDFVITSRVQTAGRIRSIYESDAPVFAESSVFHFRATPKGLVWADDEGLWMRDTDGDTVLGAYGGDAATKSWGGFTLEQGDIAFGRYGASDGGWFLFDRDGVSSKPYVTLGYSDKTIMAFDSGGASLAGVLDIDSAGGIYQGTGTFASPTAGLKMWNQSGDGRIGGYSGGSLQAFLNASGLALSIDASNPIRFIDGSSNVVGLFKQSTQSSPNRYELEVSAGHSTRAGEIVLRAKDTAGSTVSSLSLSAVTGGSGVGITTTGQVINIVANNSYVEVNPSLSVFQPSTTAAIPAMSITQNDLSEEFIEFVTTVGASNPISTSALGAYYGKARVSVNGALKWIALYN